MGLTTVTATTAAGRQAYAVPDLPDAEAIAVCDAAMPGLLDPFRADAVADTAAAARGHANQQQTA